MDGICAKFSILDQAAAHLPLIYACQPITGSILIFDKLCFQYSEEISSQYMRSLALYKPHILRTDIFMDGNVDETCIEQSAEEFKEMAQLIHFYSPGTFILSPPIGSCSKEEANLLLRFMDKTANYIDGYYIDATLVGADREIPLLVSIINQVLAIQSKPLFISIMSPCSYSNPFPDIPKMMVPYAILTPLESSRKIGELSEALNSLNVEKQYWFSRAGKDTKNDWTGLTDMDGVPKKEYVSAIVKLGK